MKNNYEKYIEIEKSLHLFEAQEKLDTEEARALEKERSRLWYFLSPAEQRSIEITTRIIENLSELTT